MVESLRGLGIAPRRRRGMVSTGDGDSRPLRGLGAPLLEPARAKIASETVD
nr:MAG TPA: hypothetical protein [Caudoviricetes sp.]